MQDNRHEKGSTFSAQKTHGGNANIGFYYLTFFSTPTPIKHT